MSAMAHVTTLATGGRAAMMGGLRPLGRACIASPQAHRRRHHHQRAHHHRHHQRAAAARQVDQSAALMDGATTLRGIIQAAAEYVAVGFYFLTHAAAIFQSPRGCFRQKASHATQLVEQARAPTVIGE